MAYNVQPYPLYDKLLQRVKNKENKSIDVSKVCATINDIAQNQSYEEANEHYREIGALILHHELLSNNGVLLSSVPYEGKVMSGGKGILYKMTNLPPLLQYIIAEYIEYQNE